MILQPGTRVRHITGREGVIVKRISARRGYYVRFDTKVYTFEPDEARVYAADLTPTDPALHEKWEAAWPAFVRKNRTWAQ